ncbi:hypothetical protein EON83_29350 [bacterium]|nr:MAG: hypothetical protein EON83_29350 [bacterium]
MSRLFQENELLPQEREQAHALWEELMFARSRQALEEAQLRLLDASVAVRSAVMHSITELWLQDYEPREDENPF